MTTFIVLLLILAFGYNPKPKSSGWQPRGDDSNSTPPYGGSAVKKNK
jgi:hypothetical protein